MSKKLELKAQDVLNITFTSSIYTKLNKAWADSSYFVKTSCDMVRKDCIHKSYLVHKSFSQ